MKDNNYIVIQGWMVNKLKLSGNELMVYAIIYGFSQDDKSGYEGGGKYLTASCGCSRRTLTVVLDKLLEKKYVTKEYFHKNINGKGQVTFCRYKTNPDFIPKDDNNEQKRTPEDAYSHERGMAETAIGGMANSAMGVWQKLPRGYSKNCHRGMAETANNITSDISKDTATTTPEQPDLIPEPPPDKETAVADVLSPEKIKQAMLDLDRSLLLKADFYPRAAAFMSLHYLDKSYLSWLYKQVELREPRDFDGLFFTLFFAENMLEKYKISKQTAKPPPPVFVNCPVCGMTHDKQAEKCPQCSLPKDSSSGQIELYRDLISLPPDKRDEYLQKYDNIYASCGVLDKQKRESLINDLKKDYFPESVYEEPSRSYYS